MANSYVTYTGNGSTQTFTVTFPYLAKSHVKVYVDGVEDTTFTWPTTSSVTLTSVPASGTTVVVKRVTPTTPLVDFIDGSNITEEILDTANLQAIYLTEETRDSVSATMSQDTADNTWDAQSKIIKNLTDPISAQHAATKNYVDTAMSSQVAQAASYASNASSSAGTATSAATSASNSASAASTSATNAANSASAASASETNAANSASAASTSATNASNSATSASTSATNAATSASAAASAASSAEAALDSFDDRYLGAKASDPTLDNDGNALITGALYFNTSSNVMKVYTGSAWEAAYATGTTFTLKTSATGSSLIPSGTQAQRDGTPAAGYFRFNSDVAKFEGYNGTAWGSVGGGATGGGGDEVFIENDQTVTTNYTIPTGRNAMTTGPITINSGVTVTVSAGSTWVVL